MYDLKTNVEWLYDELLDELKLFSEYYDGAAVRADYFSDSRLIAVIDIGGKIFTYETKLPEGEALEVKRSYKRFAKHSLYTSLSAICNVCLPWGSLTGIRPTKLAYAYIAKGGKGSVADYLMNVFSVSEAKAKLIERIVSVRGEMFSHLYGLADIYVHIPFCNGRCNYCSFPSADINVKASDGILNAYVDALCKDIVETKQLLRAGGKRVHSVYFGGGTPSVLEPRLIEKLLTALDLKDIEFTFEAGRADSVSEEKLGVMKEHGVTRICINPQTLNDKTLERIGRRHTVAQFYEAYELAQKKGFIINTDIIAGLSGENLIDFKRTADGIRSLSPHNVTVHTLSRKRASMLAFENTECMDIDKMMGYAYETFSDYEPYYLYRQKYMTGNLENIGFCKHGYICVNNVTVMEELLPVYACGAGSISKRIDGNIARYAMPKDVKLYIEQFDERIRGKAAFFGA